MTHKQTEQDFRETAANYGYSQEEIADLIKVFRDEEAEITGVPIPFEEIPLEYRGY